MSDFELVSEIRSFDFMFVTCLCAITNNYMYSFMQRLRYRNIFPFLKKDCMPMYYSTKSFRSSSAGTMFVLLVRKSLQVTTPDPLGPPCNCCRQRGVPVLIDTPGTGTGCSRKRKAGSTWHRWQLHLHSQQLRMGGALCDSVRACWC
jgi:hypothetical protein